MGDKSSSISKITRPQALGIVKRERLFRLLDRGREFPITWITGPAGSGKTALVTSYLDARKLRCLWYQVDERDADIASFFYYMGLAVKKAFPRSKKPMSLLTPEYSAGVPAFTKSYFEDLYDRLLPALGGGGEKAGFVIVLDDYQNVPVDSGFHEIIARGMDAIPRGVRVFILSRNEPPSQFARLRANEKMDFLGWDEIRFTLEESRKMVWAKGRKRIGRDVLLRLHEETEGWAAGLVLILLGLRIGKIDYQRASRFPTKEIYDYFAAEIFEKVEEETQQFLVSTAVLTRMTAPMAEKLTGSGRAGEWLSSLSENHYFTEKYSEEGPVYQYHPLFREFLLSRMEGLFNADEITRVRRKAALILEDSGRVEEAAALFREAEDWNGLIRLISGRAQSLMSQGRNKIVEEWISSIPQNVREDRPWLLYWLGLCRQPFNPPESLVLFREAFRLFQRQKDSPGTFLAWCGAVDTIIVEWNDFALLDEWIEWFKECPPRSPSFPSPEIEARVASSMAGALLYRQPYHPDIRNWLERSLSLSREMEDLNLRLHTCLYAVNYYAWSGDLERSDLVAREIRKMAGSTSASPLLVLTWKWIEALIYNRTAESSEKSLEAISEGLEIARKSGVHVWDQMLLSQGVYASLNRGDMKMAADYLGKMEATLRRGRRNSDYQFHYLAAWYHLLAEDVPRSFLHSETALTLAEETGMYFNRILGSLLVAQVLHQKGEYEKASLRLSSAKELVERMGSPMLEYLCLIKEAQFALDRGGTEKQELEALRKAMALGREHGYLNLFPWWQPSVMARLCERALSEEIETDYVRGLIRTHGLFPDAPPLEIENWPWPIEVRALGRFELLKNGKPLLFSGKVQKKPLLMLKALIARGGKDVREEMIADWFWPDADGDQAHSAFTTTLSRLRHLIGNEKAIEVLEGKVTLNPRYLWVDTWAFERVMDSVEDLRQTGRKEDEAEMGRLAGLALRLYGGPFLPGDEDYPWSISYRERLRGKFFHLISRLGDRLQKAGRPEQALEYYRRALETDELSEEIYRRLMACLQGLGRTSEAVSVYRRCQKMLDTNFGVEPSAETEALYRNLTRK